MNLVSFQTTIQSKRDRVFQFVSLFSQIDAEELQNPLFKIIRIHTLFRKLDKQIVKLHRDRKREVNTDNNR